MDMLVSVLFFIVGVILVIKGGDWFVDAASWIAKAAKIPPFIVGATIVSVATTLPEITVSLMAALDGNIEMAIGNAVGSVTANTSLIMAIALIFMKVVIRRREYIVQCSILIATAAILVIGSSSGYLASWANNVLLLLFVLFMAFNVYSASQSKETVEKIVITKKTTTTNILLFLTGIVAIVVGSQFLITGAADIATYLGIPDRIIAVTLVAIGTSLPELVTTLTAIRKKQTSLSIGNIVGANIIDLSLILPFCSMIANQELPVSELSRTVDLPACLFVLCLGFIPIILFRKSSKVQGFILIVVYAGYLVITTM